MTSNKTLAVIQARMNSRRLPAKTLAKLGNSSVIEWIIARTKKVFANHDIVVVTGNRHINNKIIDLCHSRNIYVYSGSDEDVFSRFIELKFKFPSYKYMLRICADNPFISPELMKKMLNFAKGKSIDITHTMQKMPDFPYVDGLGSELISVNALEKLEMRFKLSQYDREHVTSRIHRESNLFKIVGLPCSHEYSFPKLKLDIDSLEDLERIRKIIDFGNLSPDSTDQEIISKSLEFGRKDTL